MKKIIPFLALGVLTACSTQEPQVLTEELKHNVENATVYSDQKHNALYAISPMKKGAVNLLTADFIFENPQKPIYPIYIILSDDKEMAEIHNLGETPILLKNRDDKGYLSEYRNVWLFKTVDPKTKKSEWKLSVNKELNAGGW